MGLLRTSKISVIQDGIACVSNDILIQNIDIKGKTYWELDQKSLESNLINKFPCIMSAILSYKFPNEIKVSVKNRAPIASVVGYAPKSSVLFDNNEATPSSTSAVLDWSFPELESKKEVIDNLGKVFLAEDTSWLPLVLIDKPDLKVGDDFEDNVFRNLETALKKLPEIGISAYKFKFQGNYLLVESSPKVALDLNGDILRQVASLQLVSRKSKIDSRELEVVDLRFNKPVVIYSPKK